MPALNVKTVFVDRHSDLRSGWKILLFLTVTGVVIAALILPLQLLLPLLGRAGVTGLGTVFTSGFSLIGALMGSYILVRFVNRKPWMAIGLWPHPRMFSEMVWGAYLGFLMMAGIFGVMYATGMVSIGFRELSPGQYPLIVIESLLIFSFGAMFEEVMFRGYPFQTLMQGITLLPALLLMALLFAASHLSNPNASVFGIVNIALAAVWFSLAYLRTRNLWLPFGLHFGWNFTQTTVCSFPTSGIEFRDIRIFSTTVSGPEWLTGGAFGPEGGALATAALVVCTWFILKSTRFVIPEGIITLDSVEDLLEPVAREGGTAE